MILRRFPLRTLLLMLLALAVFVRFYCITHTAPEKRGLLQVVPIERGPQ